MVTLGSGQFMQGDCFERMAELSDASVDMILADLPYGTTRNRWDSVLPLDRLWSEYWRIAKPRAAIVLTAAQPFTSMLGASQIDRLRYSLVWKKSLKTGFLNAKRQPLKQHEDVLVFYRSQPTFTPQPQTAEVRRVSGGNRATDSYGAWGDANKNKSADFQNLPTSVVEFANPNTAGGHPTQKPVALFEYLIRTYTNPGDVVLDNTAGSGTTAIAAEQSGRRWICIERDDVYYWTAVARVMDHLAK